VARFENLEFDKAEEEPERLLARAETERERDERYWLKEADHARRCGHYENALRYYSRALELDRSLTSGWLGQSQMLVLLGEYPEAELWARKALELFRKNGDLMAARAQALCRMSDLKAAQALSDAALGQEGQSAYRWMVRGELLVSSRRELDRHCFDKAMQADPDWLVPLEAALIYRHFQLPSKALLRVRQAVEKAPGSYYCWYIQGCCELDCDLERQGRQSLARCLELSPNHLDASRRLVEVDNRGWSLKRGLRRLFVKP
jgi:tetratricopeptide (TPR) repeat protein